MIIDDNLVSIENRELTEAITGDPIALTSFQKPGRMGPIPMLVQLTEDAAGGTSLTLKLQQSDDENGTYADVPGSSMTVPLADMTMGKNIGWRYLPAGVTKPWFKVVVTPDGSFTAGRIFAAVVREELYLYEEGMYIDSGVTRG